MPYNFTSSFSRKDTSVAQYTFVGNINAFKRDMFGGDRRGGRDQDGTDSRTDDVPYGIQSSSGKSKPKSKGGTRHTTQQHPRHHQSERRRVVANVKRGGSQLIPGVTPPEIAKGPTSSFYDARATMPENIIVDPCRRQRGRKELSATQQRYSNQRSSLTAYAQHKLSNAVRAGCRKVAPV